MNNYEGAKWLNSFERGIKLANEIVFEYDSCKNVDMIKEFVWVDRVLSNAENSWIIDSNWHYFNTSKLGFIVDVLFYTHKLKENK